MEIKEKEQAEDLYVLGWVGRRSVVESVEDRCSFRCWKVREAGRPSWRASGEIAETHTHPPQKVILGKRGVRWNSEVGSVCLFSEPFFSFPHPV